MRSGFSLVELSVVLVILGLITGGILAGQALIKSAELRSITNDFGKHRTAVVTFQEKYMALPGDIRNATAYWGDQATGTAACADAAVPDGNPGTCNGNGDGLLLYVGNSEPSRLWQHLAMAGLVEGNFSGTGILDQPGVNTMGSKFSGGAFSISQATIWGFLGGVTASDGNKIIFGKTTLGAAGTATAALTPDQAWNIDTKLDDGNGYTGLMRAWNGTSAVGNCGTGAAYLLTNPGVACFINMPL